MKTSAILSALHILGMAMAMPAVHIRATNYTSSSNVSLMQAAAMGEIAVLKSLSTADGPSDPTNENGLTGPCKAVTVLFAKGTTETGNMGDGHSPGPAWVAAIRSSLGTADVTVQGIDYDASVIGYLEGGSPSGSTTYLDTISQASTQCPSTKIVLGGYSQGGQLLHNAAEQLTSDVTAKIAAVVIFGDPDLGEAVGNVPSLKVYEDCHTDDIICTGSGGSAAHLTYPADAATAAAFVVARV